MSAPIVVEGVDKSIAVGFWGRKKKLLERVSFVVDAGRTVGFVGVNGAGKSTTIKHIIGCARPTAGTIRVLGGDPREAAVRRRFGYMPELPYLPPTLTTDEVLRLHAALCVLRDPGRRIDELLELVGLAQRRRERVGTFSKGMQTRLTLALALLAEPELLILDEPMSGLDPVGRQLVRRILREQASAGRTILFSSHVLSDVEALCTDVVVIDAGTIVYTGGAAGAVGEPTGRWVVRAPDQGTPPSGGAIVDARRESDTWVVSIAATTGEEAVRLAHGLGLAIIALEPERRSLEDRLLGIIGRSSS
ncbi:MAG: ABC transporter ATP-binding protein [Deltaproteobacteria bacterium]|nr:ABC transporter ATP-binding protein [Deltaproteobacteria bacterium]